MNNSLFFLDRYNSFARSIQKSYIDVVRILGFGLGFLSIIIVPMIIMAYIIPYIPRYVPGENQLFWGIILMIFSIIGWTCIPYFMIKYIGSYLLIRPLLSLLNLICTQIKSAHTYIQKDIKNVQDIDTILEKVNELFFLHKKLIFINSCILYFHFGSEKSSFSLTLSYSLTWMNMILQNLRSDLTLRLAEQQKTLEWAKSDVEMNIRWSTELNAVSELQKARLDRQIEQFEELQRVLVKV